MSPILIFLFLTLSLSQFTHSDSLCDSGFLSNPADCTTFFQCNFGLRILRQCPPTLYWNPDIIACDWPKNVRSQLCVNPKKLESPEERTEQLNSMEESRQGLAELEGSSCISGFAPNPMDCSTFFICDHEKYVVQNCGAGLHWNPFISSCDWPANANCDPDGIQNPSNPMPSPAESTTQPSPELPPPTDAAEEVSVPVHPTIPSEWTSGRKLVCYFTDWSWYRPAPDGKFMPANIDPNLCTHIVYAFALLNGNDFTPKPADSWADFDNGFYQKVTSLKSNGTKVTLAFGGWNDSAGSKYSVLVNNPQYRARFITKTVEYLKQYNFDGLDLDWEYPTCWQGNCARGPASDKEGFALLVKEFRAALPEGYILSAAVSASKLIIDSGYDVPTLSKYLDWIGVMDYDFHGHWDRVTGHVAPLYYTPGDTIEYFNANFSIHHWIESGASRDKLVMGIPLYGQTFSLASVNVHGLNAPAYGAGEAGPYTRQGGVLAYYEICTKNWNVVQDPENRMGPYAYNGNQWVSYDDASMVTKKSEYIKEMNLGGGMIWALDMDDFTNVCNTGKYPLLTAIANSLKN